MRRGNNWKFVVQCSFLFLLLATAAVKAHRGDASDDSSGETDHYDVGGGHLFHTRDINKVTERLYISSAKGAQNARALDDIGITHVVVAAAELDPQIDGPLPSGRELQYLHLDVNDGLDENLFPFLRDSMKFIGQAMADNGYNKVLVHCYKGVNRSAAVVMAYLMLTKGYSFDEALSVLKGVRSVVWSEKTYNNTFETQLRALSSAIQARNTAAAAVDAQLQPKASAWGFGLGYIGTVIQGLTQRQPIAKQEIPMDEFEPLIIAAESNYAVNHFELWKVTHAQKATSAGNFQRYNVLEHYGSQASAILGIAQLGTDQSRRGPAAADGLVLDPAVPEGEAREDETDAEGERGDKVTSMAPPMGKPPRRGGKTHKHERESGSGSGRVRRSSSRIDNVGADTEGGVQGTHTHTQTAQKKLRPRVKQQVQFGTDGAHIEREENEKDSDSDGDIHSHVPFSSRARAVVIEGRERAERRRVAPRIEAVAGL